MSESISKQRLRLWIRLLLVTRSAEKELSEFVRTEHGTTLPRFDVLAALHRADAPLSMTELSRQLLVSNGNTTAVVARLHADGLVRRTSADSDRRVARIAKANLDELGAEGSARVICSPAQAAAGRLAGEGLEFDLIFLDPPYAESEALLAELGPALGAITAPGGRIVVESDRRDAPGLDLPMVHERRYGDTTIRIFSARE